MAFKGFNVHAQSAAEIKSSPDWTQATVTTDGGAVYSGPDFDERVSDYMPFKTKLWATKKAIAGRGGLGLFYKVRYKSKSGYMADTDIKLLDKGKGEGKTDTSDAKKSKKKSGFGDDEEDKHSGDEPLYFRRYIGGAVALVNFTEKFSGKKLSDSMLMYGLRMSGPGTLFDGPPLDVNIWFSMQKPGYYNKFTAAAPSGFLMFGDLGVTLPFFEGKDTLVHYGLGLMWVYTNYKVQVKSSHFDSQEFRIGATVDLGVTQRFGQYAVKVDGKYYYEKTQYFGGILSLQVEY